MDEVSFGLIALKIVIGFISLFIVLGVTVRIGVSLLTSIHFVFILLLDDFLGHIIYEKNENILEYLFAVSLWTRFMLGIQTVSRKFPRVRLFLQGRPYSIIQNGQLDREEIRKARLDVNQVMSLLRKQGIFSVRELEFGLLEPDGMLSVALKASHRNPTMEDLNLSGKKITLPIPLIIDGKIMRKSLYEAGFDEDWMYQELKKSGHGDEKEIFYAEWDQNSGFYVSAK